MPILRMMRDAGLDKLKLANAACRYLHRPLWHSGWGESVPPRVL